MKKVKRILSLDWDYFIKATALQRCTMFPDGGNENIGYSLQDFIWNSCYTGCPKLKDIGILQDDYSTTHYMLLNFVRNCMCNSVGNDPQFKMLVTVSHKWIYDFVMQRTEENEQFEVYNVDFHHDMYNLPRDELNCGNWVNRLFEKRPNMKYFWVNREDSEDATPIGRKPPCKTKKLKDIEDLPFDYVFICRSDCWSPPHLDSHFERLWIEPKRCMPLSMECRVMHCREVSVLSEVEQKYKEQIALSKSKEQ